LTSATVSVGTAAEIARLAHLFSHPLRVRLVTALAADGRGSATTFSDQFGDVTVGDCHYHLKALRGGGVIELAHSRRIRGATERVYRLAPQSRWRGVQHLWQFFGVILPEMETDSTPRRG
jgi:DNA-binding transcriptional ArsR family regulator